MREEEMTKEEMWQFRLAYGLLQKRIREEISYIANKTGAVIGEYIEESGHSYLHEEATYWAVGNIRLILSWSKYSEYLTIQIQKQGYINSSTLHIIPRKGEIERMSRKIDDMSLQFMKEVVKEARHGTH